MLNLTGSDEAKEVKESSKDGEEKEEGLPDTGVALSSTIAITAVILLIVGGLIVFFTRRRN